MKKLNTNHDYEINIIDLIIILWKKKIVIILIALFSFLIGVFYNYNSQKSPYFEFSLEIKQSGEEEFYKFLILKDILAELKVDQSVFQNKIDTEIHNTEFSKDPKTIKTKFIKELMDYDEIISVLKKNSLIKRKISKYSKDVDQKVRLYKYAKSFRIEKEGLDPKKIYLKFNWHDQNEGIQIMNDVLSLTLENFNNSTFENLNKLLDLKRNVIIKKDLNRIEYLLEQSAIAKELQIADSQVDTVNMGNDSNVLFNINTNNENLAYYLRGYKAIDKEISLIRNRKYQDLINIKNEIATLKNTDTKWVDYNIFLLSTKSLVVDKSKKILILSVIIGLIIGVLIALSINAYQSSIITKKKIDP